MDTVVKKMARLGTSEALPWAWRYSRVLRGAGKGLTRREAHLERQRATASVTVDQVDDRDAGLVALVHARTRCPPEHAITACRAPRRSISDRSHKSVHLLVQSALKGDNIARLEHHPAPVRWYSIASFAKRLLLGLPPSRGGYRKPHSEFFILDHYVCHAGSFERRRRPRIHDRCPLPVPLGPCQAHLLGKLRIKCWAGGVAKQSQPQFGVGFFGPLLFRRHSLIFRFFS